MQHCSSQGRPRILAEGSLKPWRVFPSCRTWRPQRRCTPRAPFASQLEGKGRAAYELLTKPRAAASDAGDSNLRHPAPEPSALAVDSPAGSEEAASTPAGPPMRLLAVDYGMAYTGLAVGRGGVPSPHKVIPSPRTGKLSDVARQVVAEAQQQGVEALLVGIPVLRGGSILKPHTDSAMGHRCRNLAHALALLGKEHGLSVYLYNEYSTTRAVLSGMGYNWQDRVTFDEQKARRVDAESAAMLLRLYYGNPRLAVRVNPRANIRRKPKESADD